MFAVEVDSLKKILSGSCISIHSSNNLHLLNLYLLLYLVVEILMLALYLVVGFKQF
jgi:hypothetical protein